MLDRDPRASPAHPESLWARRLRCSAAVGGAVALLVGVVVLVGWAADVPTLTTVLPGEVSTKFNAAVGLVSLGVAATLLSRASRGPGVVVTVTGLAALALVVGAATLVEYVAGIDLGIDNPFGLDRPGAVGTSRPGRMSPATALCLTGLGAAVLATLVRWMRWAQGLAAATLLLGLVAVIGYLFRVESLYRIDVYTSMAVPTAAALSVLSVAVLSLRADHGFMHLLTGDSIGAVLLRRLLPLSLLTPIGVGAVLMTGLERGLYDIRSALALLVTFATVVGVIGVWLQCRELGKVDLRRADAEDMQERLRQSLVVRDRLASRLIKSESHARSVVENSADAYIALTPTGHVEDWNGAATDLFGWTSEEATSRYLDDLIIPPALAAAHRKGLRRASRTGQGPILGRPLELDAVHRDGRHLVVELTVWAVPVGTEWGFHAFLRDVTARRKADSELHRMNDDLRQFAGVVAHDLRTPLTTITGYSELLRESTEDGGAAQPLTLDWIRRVEDASRRGTDLIADLLAMTQIGLGDLTTERVDLDELLAAVVGEQRSLGHADATIEVAPLTAVMGDVGLLRQLFANLIGNALKYAGSREGHAPTVQVGVEPAVTPGRVVVHVSDDGPGIADADRSRVFDMFQRGADVGSVEGTGIGLAIGRQVVERHHGRIWVDRSDLGGAAFHVELPAAPIPW